MIIFESRVSFGRKSVTGGPGGCNSDDSIIAAFKVWEGVFFLLPLPAFRSEIRYVTFTEYGWWVGVLMRIKGFLYLFTSGSRRDISTSSKRG